MPGSYSCTKMLVKVDGNTLGVVTGLDIELTKEGGVEPVFGTDIGVHRRAGRKATFRIQRLFKADTDTDLLFDLFDLELPFSLSGEIDGVAGSTLNLSDCGIYRFRLITGDANSAIGEEASGEALRWNGTDIT